MADQAGNYGAGPSSWAVPDDPHRNVALESMGFQDVRIRGGRADTWDPKSISLGSEDKWLGDERYSGDRELAPTLALWQMGLIYVNPKDETAAGPDRARRRDIRETFAAWR